MNNGVQLRIGQVPWRYAAGLVTVPGLTIERGSPWQIRAGEQKWLLSHIRPEEGPRDPKAFAAHARRAARPNLPLVVSPYLRREVRESLEASDVSYLDFRGNVHLVAPGVLVHVRTPAHERPSRRLGLAGLRAAQLVLEDRERAWSVTDVAQVAAVSIAHAHRVIAVLESEDLVVTEGRGPQKRRRVREPARFLDWLASQEPKRAPRHQATVAVYARNPADLWKSLHVALSPIGYALTGAAAASVLGSGPTSVPRSLVRVSPEASLTRAVQLLAVEPSDRGPNVVLWSDTGRLGTVGAWPANDVRLAPRVRIYLDALGETRGEDTATLFREQVLGY